MLQIPSVTQDDLNAFHIRVFGSAVAPIQSMLTEPRLDNEVMQEATLEEGDDLGYYPDGNKRTLTDDQVAMFRHSEIYSILRERQVRKENEEADGDDPRDDLASHPAATPEGVIPDEIKTIEDHDQPYLDHHANSHGDSQGNLRYSVVRNKRKRTSEDAGDSSGKASTRRLVRELDSITAEDQVLDYGDEPAEEPSTTHAHPGKARADVVADHHGRIASVPGKKIWWPTIHAT